ATPGIRRAAPLRVVCAAVLASVCSAPSPPHLLLRSFPTRRSSDLPSRRSASRRCRRRGGSGPVRPAAGGGTRCTTCRSPASGTRSEEHTSELQSHLNIVCRLLLEKKNNHPGRHYH